MTVSTTASSITVSANGSSSYQFPFIAVAASDIAVAYTPLNGALTTLSPSAYTVYINPPVTGQIWGVGGVIFPNSPSSYPSGTLTISRVLPLTQTAAISNQGNQYPIVTEQALDTLCMEIQQLSARGGAYRGTWATGSVYNFGDIVQDGSNGALTNNIYVCAKANTSGTWSTDLANGDWVLAIQSVIPTASLPLSIGNGGTGQSTASAALTALGAAALSGAAFTGAVSVGSSYGSFKLSVVQPNSNVGYFGSTGSYQSNLVIDNQAGGQGSYLQLANAGTTQWYITSDGSNNFHLNNGAGSWITANTGSTMTIGPAQTFNLSQSGLVGIGASPSTYQIKVVQAGTSQAYFGSTGNNQANVYIDNAAGGKQSTLNFLDAGVNKWYIDNDLNNNFHIAQSGVGSWIGMNAGGDMNIGLTGNLAVEQNGNIRIDAPTSNQSLQITAINGGNAVFIQNVSGTSTYNGFLFRTNGGVTQVGSISITSTATAYNTSSDKRLKNNVAPLGNVSAKIDAMQPVTYNWQYLEGNPSGVGFLAQDLYNIAPEAVTAGDNGIADETGKVEDQWSVDYSKLVPYLVAEIQSLRARLKTAGIA